jgi:DNA (cytosine-5)-methyltransferase 1
MSFRLLEFTKEAILMGNSREGRLPFLDFFAGSGLVSQGMKDHFYAAWANDICHLKAKVYKANHKNHPFSLCSIEDINGSDLPAAALAWASFPCQDLSLAGKLLGIGASRSGLVWQWLRVLDEMHVKPSLLLAENVVGLVSSAEGEHYRVLHRALRERGYLVGAMIVDAERWIPQSRPRVFVVAVTEETDVGEFSLIGPSWNHPKAIQKAMEGCEGRVWWSLPLPPTRAKKLSDLIDFKAPCDDPKRSHRNVCMIPETHLDRLLKEGHKVAPGYKRTRKGKQVLELRFDDVAGCLRTPEGGSSRQYLIIPKETKIETRLLTIREAASLMGTPRTYRLPGVNDRYKLQGSYNEGYKAMGDAVAVPVSRYLAKHLLSPLAFITEAGSIQSNAI